MSSKNILIIGKDGLIGSNIYEKLTNEDYNVIGVDYPEIDVRSSSSINNFISKINNLNIDCLIMAFGLNDHVKKIKEKYYQ